MTEYKSFEEIPEGIVNPMVECWDKETKEKELIFRRYGNGELFDLSSCDGKITYRCSYYKLNKEFTLIDPSKPIPKRHMTPFEAQAFARKLFLEEPNARVSDNGIDWCLPIYLPYYDYNFIKDYSWSILDYNGNPTTINKFEV